MTMGMGFRYGYGLGYGHEHAQGHGRSNFLACRLMRQLGNETRFIAEGGVEKKEKGKEKKKDKFFVRETGRRIDPERKKGINGKER